MIPRINLGSRKQSWLAPLVAWVILTGIGSAAYGLKVGSFSDALIGSPLIAMMAALAACWPVVSFLGAHSSDLPIRRLLLTIYAIGAFVWSAWAMAEVMSSTSSTAPVGLVFLVGTQGLAFVFVYVVARIFDWVIVHRIRRNAPK